MTTHDDLLTTTEAAEITGLSRDRITQYCRAGTIPAMKIGRDWVINREDLAGITRQRKPKQRRGEGK